MAPWYVCHASPVAAGLPQSRHSSRPDPHPSEAKASRLGRLLSGSRYQTLLLLHGGDAQGLLRGLPKHLGQFDGLLTARDLHRFALSLTRHHGEDLAGVFMDRLCWDAIGLGHEARLDAPQGGKPQGVTHGVAGHAAVSAEARLCKAEAFAAAYSTAQQAVEEVRATAQQVETAAMRTALAWRGEVLTLVLDASHGMAWRGEGLGNMGGDNGGDDGGKGVEGVPHNMTSAWPVAKGWVASHVSDSLYLITGRVESCESECRPGYACNGCSRHGGPRRGLQGINSIIYPPPIYCYGGPRRGLRRPPPCPRGYHAMHYMSKMLVPLFRRDQEQCVYEHLFALS